jgi:hypothetical protein
VPVTARYGSPFPDNTGLGIFSNEFSAGATFFFDAAKKWHIASTALYQIQSTTIGTDKKVGDTLLLEGGLGRSIFRGNGNVGVAYYYFRKITEDRNYTPPPEISGRFTYFGIGPEIDVLVPIPASPMVLTLRYLFETGNRNATEGNTLVALLTYAFPRGK